MVVIMSRYLDLKAYRKRAKARAVIYKGGYCFCCGYNRSIESLSFHHTNPDDKEFSISRAITNGKSWQILVTELSKCIMVCANCHSEIHDIECSTSLRCLSEQPTHEEGMIMISQSKFPFKEEQEKSLKCICGKRKTAYGKRCLSCARRSMEKISWPPSEKLIKMVADTNYSKVAKALGVSDNSVRKRVRNHCNKQV